MDSLLRSTLLKLAMPLGVIVIALVAAQRKNIAWGSDLGLNRPRARDLALWLGLWILWLAASEWIIDVTGMDQAQRWPAYPVLIVVLRVLAIGIVGPISEELVMRGMLFLRLSRTPLRPIGAILVCAAAWSLLHVQYGWNTRALIFCDGLILGFARLRSRSVTMPIVMHVIANLYSISQSLH